MQRLHAEVYAIRQLADGVREFELRSPDDDVWPAVSAGAHIDVFLPNELVRSYSLTNSSGEAHRYTCAVSLDPSSRGGSAYMHRQLRVGDRMWISAPRNAFPLNEAAARSVFIAGGIGITPLWSMIQRVAALDQSWELYYSARSPEVAAYSADVAALADQSKGRVVLNFDEGEKARRLDIASIVASCAEDAHLYCCGPAPMLQAFEAACEGRDPDTVHREYFSAPTCSLSASGEPEAQREFRVVLSKANITLAVKNGMSILDAVLDAGVDVPFSCMSGVCRSCETRVLAGVPDHRDLVLTDTERNAGDTMIICCSGAKSDELILDL